MKKTVDVGGAMTRRDEYAVAITNLGRFSTAEAAAEAYNRAATATHGPFANLGTAA